MMSVNPYSLAGKLVLVTGAGTGIGQGIALAAGRAGADVVLHYATNTAGASDAVAELTGLGRRACAIQADLRSAAECKRVVDEAAAFLGGLDSLVSNAGVTLTTDILEVSEDQFDRTYALNIRGQFFCAQQAVRHIIDRGAELRRRAPECYWAGGSIINISSVHAQVGLAGHSVYASTKGAIVAFSRELAVELLPAHIRVNVIAPGSIEVPSYYKMGTYTREVGNAMVPWGRVGIPSDVAHLAVYLLSDASEFMTGQALYLDGGLTAKMALPYQPPTGER
jgi:NAD(P)-dependent dehydrogenase (short-subunit alcohol dehydrogenase family)